MKYLVVLFVSIISFKNVMAADFSIAKALIEKQCDISMKKSDDSQVRDGKYLYKYNCKEIDIYVEDFSELMSRYIENAVTRIAIIDVKNKMLLFNSFDNVAPKNAESHLQKVIELNKLIKSKLAKSAQSKEQEVREMEAEAAIRARAKELSQ